MNWLERFIQSDRPDYLIRLHTISGLTFYFNVHKRATDLSHRLKLLIDHDVEDLQHIDVINRVKKRRRKSYTGDCVKVVDFKIEWIDAYRLLFPEDHRVFRSFLLHLYKYIDYDGNEAHCPFIGEELDENDHEITCSNTGTADESIVLLSLMKFFFCPLNMQVHLNSKLIRFGSFTNSRAYALELLVDMIIPNEESLATKSMLKNMLSLLYSLINSPEPSENPQLHLLGDLVSSVTPPLIQLQTFGMKSCLSSYEAENLDTVSHNGLELSLYINHPNSNFTPHLMFIEDFVHECQDICDCCILSESSVYSIEFALDHQYTQTFSLVRDLRFLDNYILDDDGKETIRLRGRNFFLDISYEIIIESNRQQYLTFSASLVSKTGPFHPIKVELLPEFKLQGSLVHVFGDEHLLDYSGLALDRPNSGFSVSYDSKGWHCSTNFGLLDQFEFSQNQTESGTIVKKELNVRSNFKNMRSNYCEDWTVEECVPRPLILSGSITFRIAKD